jgi:hypothetical protein
MSMYMDPFHLAGEFSCVGLEETNQIRLRLAVLQGSVWLVTVQDYSTVVTVCSLIQVRELFLVKIWAGLECGSEKEEGPQCT